MDKYPGKKFRKYTKDNRGFTLLELLAAVGILGLLCAIAIPSLAATASNLAFARRNQCARQIFLAAQENLTQMRAQGSLNCLRNGDAPALSLCGAPAGDWSAEYVYTASGLNGADTYALVLPEGSVDDTLRNQQVIIEYNPLTGSVFSVFYTDRDDFDLLSAYTALTLPRNGEGDWPVGYYEGSVQTSRELEILQTQASMTFLNGEEGILSLKIPIPEPYLHNHNAFIRGLEVLLTLRSQSHPEKAVRDIPVKLRSSCGANCTLDVDGRTVLITYVLDSLADRRSFANLVTLAPEDTGQSLTALRSESSFPAILPGENVTVQACITFHSSGSQLPVLIGDVTLPGVNPMFDMLTENSSGGYTLTISNGRNLQNLNALAPSVAAAVTELVFTEDIYWNRTVDYYNRNYGNADSYQNREDEAPARALPFFVPISNGTLLGSAEFVWETRTDGAAVPLLLDPPDQAHARISGLLKDGTAVRIFNLNIDSSAYALPAGEGCYYVTGPEHPVRYAFTGLFACLNTEIDNVCVVNPIIKGMPFRDDLPNGANPATGALIGAAGGDTRITTCAVYIDTGASFDRDKLTQTDYDPDRAQTWYGVSGEGAVGGLVGYIKSCGEEAAVSHCFAAVNVSGNMRGTEDNHFGYSNGIGGLVGNCQLVSFSHCYASGNVLARNCYVVPTAIADPDSGHLDSILGESGPAQLSFCGRRSMGAGGFAGTSHGSRYGNCFSSGNVTGSGSTGGAGGFVGIMCYEETLALGLDDSSTEIAGMTVFENCYALGISRINGQLQESFSGANARIKLQQEVAGSYYRTLAPHSAGLLPDLRYIFKDSYYLSRGTEASQRNTGHCAAAESYEHLTQLHMIQRSAYWISQRVGEIRQIPLGEESAETYESAYFAANPLLSDLYAQAYSGGFPTGSWESIPSDRTHPYSLTVGNAAYPFPMLTGLDYYGNWPGRPLVCGIVYYEDYPDGTTGYYYDREETATLDQHKAVISEGYAILTASRDDLVQVTIQGKSMTLASGESGEYRPGGADAVNVYRVFRIPWDLYRDAPVSESGYLTANVYIRTADNQESQTSVSFNPNTALSHLAGAAPVQPPAEVYIRTPRQFAALGGEDMAWAWTEGTTIIQQRDLNGAEYDWNRDGTVNGEDTSLIPLLHSIGREAQPFRATYSGGGCVVEGFLPTNSIFGTVGPSGIIRGLKIRVTGDTTIGDGQADACTGLLASYCSGKIENVILALQGNLTLAAGEGAGILAGCISGTEGAPAVIRGCAITAENITVRCENAGALGGILENSTVENLTVHIQGIYRSESGIVAGVAAQTTDSRFLNMEVTISGTLTGDTAAGAFGNARNVTLRNARVTVTGKLSGRERAAGFAAALRGQVENALVCGDHRTAGGSISGGGEAAGFALILSGSDTVIRGSGITPAAGDTPEDYLDSATTNLTVHGTAAALFAREIRSGVTVSGCFALGAVTGETVSGFAETNSGTIRGSTANVTITGGHAFVQNNAGTIENCYGWYGDGHFDGEISSEPEETTALMGGSVAGCYFADRDVPVLGLEEAAQMPWPERYKSVLVYDSGKNILTLSLLDEAFTPELLNGQQGSAWFAPGSFDALPFSSLLPKFYPYPMLRIHWGDWAPVPG